MHSFSIGHKRSQDLTSGEADDEDSGDSDGESSTQSSHGEAESVDEPKKPKRTRTAFSNLQLDQLELAFSRSHYPDVFTREDLSNKLNIKEDRIQVRLEKILKPAPIGISLRPQG